VGRRGGIHIRNHPNNISNKGIEHPYLLREVEDERINPLVDRLIL
jgi:hypothetical protein